MLCLLFVKDLYILANQFGRWRQRRCQHKDRKSSDFAHTSTHTCIHVQSQHIRADIHAHMHTYNHTYTQIHTHTNTYKRVYMQILTGFYNRNIADLRGFEPGKPLLNAPMLSVVGLGWLVVFFFLPQSNRALRKSCWGRVKKLTSFQLFHSYGLPYERVSVCARTVNFSHSKFLQLALLVQIRR